MTNSFGQEYAALTDFIRNHPEIEIGESVTSIPENVRADFYVLFNAAREALIAERFPALLSRAEVLQEEYAKAENGLADRLSWEETATIDPVLRFLRNYRESMTRELFDPLFDLLKGKNTIGSFGQICSGKITALWPALFRGGYEKWVLLSLVKLLEPEQILRVESRLLGPGERGKPAASAPFADIPDPEVSHTFFFSQPANAVFAVPDLIVRSGVLSRFAAMRSEFREGMYHALNASPDREWTAVDTDLLIALEHGLILLYSADRAEDIALVADVRRCCRPDTLLWCIDSGSMNPDEVLAGIELIDGRLGPVAGSFVIADEDWAEAATEQIEDFQNRLSRTPRIRFLRVGYDPSRLAPVIDALRGLNSPAMT